ncbi:MAG: ABC transporter ATP-binding protein [Acetobacteraceae bacterium]
MRRTDAAMQAAEHALECRDITVRFGTVVALNDVSVGFPPGRIHAVVGQNGAGKTTFARVAGGIVRPDSGTLRIAGHEVVTGTVAAARAAGVELVHQSFALPPSFTVAEAMEFGSTRHRDAPFTRARLEARWRPHLASLGLKLRPGERVRDLPVESKQAVEIARALVADARVLILDEPTAVLPPPGIATLFHRLQGLCASGVTIILILHKIREVLAVADTVTVLRGGRRIEGPIETSAIDAEQLAAAIVGATAGDSGGPAENTRTASAPAAASRGRGARAASAALELEEVSTRADGESRRLEGVSLCVRRGEIVGIAGVEGNGQRTLVRASAGLARIESGAIRLAGQMVTELSPLARRAGGLSIIPFERNTEGLSLSSALWENWAARALLLRGRMLAPINPRELRARCDASLRSWDVRFAATAQKAGSLSGGNAQKLILAREIDDSAVAVIAAQPTRGLDVGATGFVWRALRAARARGSGVLLISSDLDELFDISDRIVVLLSGRVAGEFTPPYSLEAVGQAMTGVGQ